MTQENAAAGAVLGAVAGVGGAIGAAVGSLFQAEGFLSNLMDGAQASSQKFHVNKDNVLQAGKIIRSQAEELDGLLFDTERLLQIHAEGSGEVSEDIAKAWNSRLVGSGDSYAAVIRKYVEALTALADQLREAATQYGFTEEEVTTAFGMK